MPRATDDADPSQLLSDLHDVCRRAAAPYAIIGGIAILAYGGQRSTMDLDLSLGLEPRGVDRFLELAEGAGFATDPHEFRDRFKHQMLRLWRFRVDGHPVKVDINLAVLPHMRLALSRRRKKRVLGRFYWFAAPEDLIVLKLIAGRSHDLTDAAFLLTLPPGTIDRRYLRRTVRKWRLESDLEKAELRAIDPRT